MSAHTHIQIQNRRYLLKYLPPLEAFALGNQVFSLLGSSFFTLVNKISSHSHDQTSSSYNQRLLSAIAVFSALPQQTGALFFHQAITRCSTPNGESLEDSTTFNKWFSVHRSDLYLLAARAFFELNMEYCKESNKYQHDQQFITGEHNTSMPMPASSAWQARALALRAISLRACSYTELVYGPLTLKDLFEILRIADLRDYTTTQLLKKGSEDFF